MTQAEIGHHLGLTPVHVNRTIQELRRRQLIRTNSTGVDLLDLTLLQRVAGFSPRYLTMTPSGLDQSFDA
jgi:DNA-binding transcriptional regulator LsrR (DeoR family)